MRKVEHQEDEDQGGAAILGLAALAGLGLWAWRRKKAAQPVGPAFALVPTNQSQGQDQRVRQGMILPRGDFMGPRRQGTDRSQFGFAW